MIGRAMLAALLLAGAAGAQPAPCDGQRVTMRISKLKPGGSRAGFEAAVAAHRAWYRANGATGNALVVAGVLVPVNTGGRRVSTSQFVTLHADPPVGGVTAAQRASAGWKAFVAKYEANSGIESETRLCLPKGARLTVEG